MINAVDKNALLLLKKAKLAIGTNETQD